MARKAPARRPRPGMEERRKRGCKFCQHNVEQIDYKLTNVLRSYMSEKGKIRARRATGVCRNHQGQLSVAVKRARELALLRYVGQ